MLCSIFGCEFKILWEYQDVLENSVTTSLDVSHENDILWVWFLTDFIFTKNESLLNSVIYYNMPRCLTRKFGCRWGWVSSIIDSSVWNNYGWILAEFDLSWVYYIIFKLKLEFGLSFWILFEFCLNPIYYIVKLKLSLGWVRTIFWHFAQPEKSEYTRYIWYVYHGKDTIFFLLQRLW